MDQELEKTQPGKDKGGENNTLTFLAGLALYLVLALVLWWSLDRYIDPGTSAQKKDLVQALALIMAGVAGGVGIYFTWRGQQLNLESVHSTLQMNWEQENLKWETTALQKYFEHIEDLVTKENLRSLERNNPVRVAAQATTWALMQMLYTHRKYFQLQFLYRLELISGEDPAISLRGVNLWAIKLSGDDLNHINLSGVHLSPWPPDAREGYRSYLLGTVLDHAILAEANLSKADLRRADLTEANLRGAKLVKADLSEWNIKHLGTDAPAYLQRTTLDRVLLRKADLTGADLTGANLTAADLSGADLTGANLTAADLTGVDLIGANLTAANLSGADLTRANVTEEQLNTVSSLKGTIMPDRSRHE